MTNGKSQANQSNQKYHDAQRTRFPERSGDKFYTYLKHSDMMMYIMDKIHFQYIIAIYGGV